MSAISNSYAQLPPSFYQEVNPTAALSPKLIHFNQELAEFLGLKNVLNLQDQSLPSLLSGQTLLPDSKPIAMAYAGHQFGHFVPQLGDGRALLLGEATGQDGLLYDLHLKGAGRTPFSRGGDGKSALGPVLREYLVSEGMYSLGIPTTRALGAVETGEEVEREEPLKGATFLRVAKGHIRIGTFEYFSSRGQIEDLKALADYCIRRFDSELVNEPEKYRLFFESVAKRVLALVAQWMGVGFIHGVMNTDNISIAGETIDYGPCAFLDEYKSTKVFSSIDKRGRYAYKNQGPIALWNLSVLANALFPLMLNKGVDEEEFIQEMQNTFESLQSYFEEKHLLVMAKKIGLFEPKKEDLQLVHLLLRGLEEQSLDFTNSFRELEKLECPIKDFEKQWKKRLEEQSQSPDEVISLIQSQNPFLIPRNHQVERVIESGYSGDYKPFHELLEALKSPYLTNPKFKHFTIAPQSHERVTKTFCGT